MDSSGVAGLMRLHRETIDMGGVPLTLVNPSAAVRRVLEITGVDQIVNITS